MATIRCPDCSSGATQAKERADAERAREIEACQRSFISEAMTVLWMVKNDAKRKAAEFAAAERARHEAEAIKRASMSDTELRAEALELYDTPIRR